MGEKNSSPCQEMQELVNMIFTLKNFKEGEKIPNYLQNKLFNATEGAGIFHIFTSEGKKRCVFPALSVNLQCLKGWHLYLFLVQSREFWPRIFFCGCFCYPVYMPVEKRHSSLQRASCWWQSYLQYKPSCWKSLTSMQVFNVRDIIIIREESDMQSSIWRLWILLAGFTSGIFDTKISTYLGRSRLCIPPALFPEAKTFILAPVLGE